jgi:hypothetical protein
VAVSPSVTTTYTLTATGPGGQSTSQATVTVTPAGFNQTIAITGTGPVNLRTLADTAGYNGTQNATVTFTLASGVTITGAAGAPNGGIAIDTGTWPTASFTITLTIQISGKVYGGGARGGVGAVNPHGGAGGSGGDAIHCRLPISITVNSGGEVRAGGGGGGGGGGRTDNTLEIDRVGGGGGGGFPNGPGASAGTPVLDGVSDAGNGASGTTSGGGAGGAGETGGGGAGGAGGGAGAAGAAGSPGSGSGTVKNPGAGGVAGFAVRKNGHTVTVTNNGTISGAVS